MLFNFCPYLLCSRGNFRRSDFEVVQGQPLGQGTHDVPWADEEVHRVAAKCWRRLVNFLNCSRPKSSNHKICPLKCRSYILLAYFPYEVKLLMLYYIIHWLGLISAIYSFDEIIMSLISYSTWMINASAFQFKSSLKLLSNHLRICIFTIYF